jgi:hypothetical protein
MAVLREIILSSSYSGYWVFAISRLCDSRSVILVDGDREAAPEAIVWVNGFAVCGCREVQGRAQVVCLIFGKGVRAADAARLHALSLTSFPRDRDPGRRCLLSCFEPQAFALAQQAQSKRRDVDAYAYASP